MKINLLLIYSLLFSIAANSAECRKLSFHPLNNPNWEFSKIYSDEFSGSTLDIEKWTPFNPAWNGRPPGYFSPKNVKVVGGMLELTSKFEDLPNLPKGYERITTAAVKSKNLILYGYLEVRSRSMKSRVSSSFWLYNDTPTLWTEIDVFETSGLDGKYSNTVFMNLHVFRTPESNQHWETGGRWVAPFSVSDDFHLYAVNWTKDRITWLVDNCVVLEKANTHWHQPLFINFDSETMPKWFGLPDQSELPGTFAIDYIRVWQKSN